MPEEGSKLHYIVSSGNRPFFFDPLNVLIGSGVLQGSASKKGFLGLYSAGTPFKTSHASKQSNRAGSHLALKT